MWKKLKTKAATFWSDEGGSESIEFLFASASMFGLILVAFIIFSYAVELNLVNTAVKRVAREVEVAGKYSTTTMNSNFKSYVGSSESLTYDHEPVRIYDIKGSLPGNKIQLKGTFKVEGKVTFEIPVIHPLGYAGFNIDLPLQSTVSGMSEVYWR